MKSLRIALLTTLLSVSGIAFASDEFRVGDIKIEKPFARATVPAQKAGGGLLTIENKGAADRLLSASSPASKTMELHTMSMEDNVMKMREVKAIDVPAKGKVELKPGGLHLMFIDLNGPLKAGEVVPVKLRFEKAGEVEIKVKVIDMKGGHSGHGGHGSHKH